MAVENSAIDFWSLTSSQLALQIGMVADGDTPETDDGTRAEAGQLASEWHDAISLPHDTFQNQERQAAQLDALRKRTIQILVKVSQSK